MIDDGKLIKSEERFESEDRLDITWFFDAAGKAVRAERDSDGDGHTDLWLFYESGRLAQVEEDTNGDGKADLWETYDASEAMIKRARDINLDGKPDVIEEGKL